MEKVDKALEEVVSCIINSKEYKKCIELQKRIEDNKELMELIEKVKVEQKKYIRSNYDDKIKNNLNEYYKQLEEIPIYRIYLDNLSVVNQKISYVKDELNDYFDKLLNTEKNTSN